MLEACSVLQAAIWRKAQGTPHFSKIVSVIEKAFHLLFSLSPALNALIDQTSIIFITIRCTSMLLSRRFICFSQTAAAAAATGP